MGGAPVAIPPGGPLQSSCQGLQFLHLQKTHSNQTVEGLESNKWLGNAIETIQQGECPKITATNLVSSKV